MANKLRLTVKQIRALQKKHGISNLLNPDKEDGPKLANLDFLAEFYYEGSRSWDSPPDLEAVEDVDFSELVSSVQSFLKGESGAEGKA